MGEFLLVPVLALILGLHVKSRGQYREELSAVAKREYP